MAGSPAAVAEGSDVFIDLHPESSGTSPQAELLLGALMNSVLDPIYFKDRDGRYVRINQALAERSGLDDPAEALGKTDFDFFTEAHARPAREDEQRILATGEPLVNKEEKETWFDGRESWVLTTKMPWRDEAGNIIGTFGISRDITRRKLAQREAREAAETLGQYSQDLARSNAELERFAYIVSHDLTEPLRTVSSFCQLLQDRSGGALDDDANEYIEHAVAGAARMKALLDDLLRYSRVQRSKERRTDVDCQALLEEVRLDLKAAIEESGTTLSWDEMPTIQADRTQLGQLLQNLIGNAIKYRGTGPATVHVAAESRNDGWLFAVRDQGMGIAARDHKRIFEIFQRLHGRDEYPGTGVGLAICKRIVEGHGGRIWVESNAGRGSTFFFSLPTDGPEEPA